MASSGFVFDQRWWAGAISFPSIASVFGSYDTTTESWGLQPTQQSIGTGIGILAVVVGLFIGPILNECFGRWRTFFAQAIVVLLGVIVEATSFHSYAQLIIDRAIVYIGGGIATNVVPVYQAECAPPALRGLMTTAYNGSIMLGALISSLILYLCRDVKSDWSWRGVVVVQIVGPIICLLGIFFLPESPRWLVKEGRIDDAANALRRLRKNHDKIEEEVDMLRGTINHERTTEGTSYVECFRGTNLRRITITVGVQVLQQALGIFFIGDYLGVFLVQIGFTDSLLIVMITYIIGAVTSYLLCLPLIFRSTQDAPLTNR
ncbi:general substrate transporter [Aspergillus cavernicola]|uniref:General substrate transporter n=1 Tax=Aspergillus cavernicola TaxID=176166 RepID=A0ABR4IUL2_9EURO